MNLKSYLTEKGKSNIPENRFFTISFKCLLFSVHRVPDNDLTVFLQKLPVWIDGIVILNLTAQEIILPDSETRPVLIINNPDPEILKNADLQFEIASCINPEWLFLLDTNEQILHNSDTLDLESEKRNEAAMISFYTFYSRDGKTYYACRAEPDKKYCRLFRTNDLNRTPESSRTGTLSARLAIMHKTRDKEDGNFTLTSPLLNLDEIYFVADTFRNAGSISDKDIFPILEAKLKKIAEYLYAENSPQSSIGLYTGLSGKILFFLLLYDYTKEEKFQSKAYEYLDLLLELLEKNKNYRDSFCDGMAGFGWLVCYLSRHNFIDIPEDYLDELDTLLFERMQKWCKEELFDQMHQAISIGWYFLKRNKKRQIRTLLKALQNAAVKDGNEIKWESRNFLTKKLKYDFGLAHGMAGILVFLSKCYLANIEKDTCLELINGIFRFYLRNEQKYQDCGSFFPTFIFVEEYRPGTCNSHARLAWCYGDLGVLYSIYLSGKYTKNEQMQEYALIRLRQSALRRNLNETQVFDAAFCHGASSLAYVFNKMYYYTGETVFKETALYWYKVSIILGNNNQNPSGFVFYAGPEEWVDDKTLLNGVTGVGISLIFAFTYKNIDWDECMMLS